MLELIIAALPHDVSVPTAALTALAILLTLALIAGATLLVVRLTAYAAARRALPPRRPSRLTIVRNAQGE